MKKKFHKPSNRKGSRKARLPKSLKTFDETIVLIGLMGAGKTTVGRRLAKVLGLPFVDSDHEIETAAAMSVAEIFETYGEEEFRSGERRVIERLLSDNQPKVLALGGGAFLNDETRELVKDKGLSIWLDVDVDVLVQRTSRRNTRPLLREGDPAEILTKLAKQRYPIYAEADLTVKSSNGQHANVVSAMVETLKTYVETKEDNS